MAEVHTHTKIGNNLKDLQLVIDRNNERIEPLSSLEAHLHRPQRTGITPSGFFALASGVLQVLS